MQKYAYFLAGLLFLTFGFLGNTYAHPGGGHSDHSDSKMQDLKSLEPDQVVVSLNHCNELYVVVMASGPKRVFKEFDLRLKLDTSDLGPTTGKPVLLPAGMGGDRAFVVFSSVADLKSTLQAECKK